MGGETSNSIVNLVLQRYKGSSEIMRPADNLLWANDLLGDYWYGREHYFEDKAGIDTFSASI